MKTGIVLTVFYIALVVGLLVGEIKCVVKAFQCNWDPIGKSEIIYTASACCGLGAIVGYIDIQDK